MTEYIETIYGIPPALQEYLEYLAEVKNLTRKTVLSYCRDIRIFMKYIKLHRHISEISVPFEDIDITDVDEMFLASVTLDELYRFQKFSIEPGKEISVSSSRRRTTSIKSLYSYLTLKKHAFARNPGEMLEMPAEKRKKKLKYLKESECKRLLSAPGGHFAERDYAILMVFLSCGLRISELTNLNISDIYSDYLIIRPAEKRKERKVYFAEGCREAIDEYLNVRDQTVIDEPYKDALFISRNGKRISTRAVEKMVKKRLKQAGLDSGAISPSKLRHSAAKLMVKNGVDLSVLKEVLGHSRLGSTQVYSAGSPDEDLNKSREIELEKQ